MLLGKRGWKLAAVLAGTMLIGVAAVSADGPGDGKGKGGPPKDGPRAGRPQGPPSAAKIFELLDADKNGSVSKEEFEAGHKRRMEHMRAHGGPGDGRGPGGPGRSEAGRGPGGPGHHGHAAHHGPPHHGRAGHHGPRHHGHAGHHGSRHGEHGSHRHGSAHDGHSRGHHGECPHCRRGKDGKKPEADGKGDKHEHPKSKEKSKSSGGSSASTDGPGAAEQVAVEATEATT